MTSKLEIHMFPCLSDNYGFLIHDPDNDLTACIDTPDSRAILEQLRSKGWTLTHILNTHHHHDHAGGNLELKRATGCTVIGNAADAGRIPGIDHGVRDGDTFPFGAHTIHVLETPGHTVGHIVYHIPDQSLAFVGDTLFAMGCGRLFEGTPGQMWHSLSRIRQWPADTRIYCAHEYTLANARFAMSVDSGNHALEQRVAEVEARRDKGLPTIPTTLALELETNPFLRADVERFAAGLGMQGAAPADVFAETRRRKDEF
jgi:hydroxyacylglutathione hydrolase